MQAFSLEVRKKYKSLRKSEKRVADVLLSSSFDILNSSIEDLAKEADVSQPTIIRFAKALGCKGYKDVKKILVSERIKKEQNNELTKVLSFVVSAEDKLVDTPTKVVTTHINQLKDLLKNLSSYEFMRAVEKIINAKNIVVFAVENSTCVADDLKTKLIYMGFNVVFHSDPYLQKISAKNLNPDDVAIGISYTGFSTITVDALAAAKSAGAATIAISNSENALINKYSDIILCTGNEQFLYGSAIFSRCMQIALIDMLYTGILITDYKKYSELIEKNTEEITSFAYPYE